MFLAQTYINNIGVNLDYIEIEPKWPTAETSRIGTPLKFIQAETTQILCYLFSYQAEIIWTGLLQSTPH